VFGFHFLGDSIMGQYPEREREREREREKQTVRLRRHGNVHNQANQLRRW